MTHPAPVAFLFNGDADGILSQHMLYLAGIQPTLRITGMKRDIALLERLPLPFSGDVHVLDISLKTNAKAAQQFLATEGGHLTWYDHHERVDIPDGPRFKTHIHPTAGQCTALIVNSVHRHAFDLWATAAAFGDNVTASAEALIRKCEISLGDRNALAELGELVNYNGYGEPEDAWISPLTMAQKLEGFENPLVFFRESGIFEGLAHQLKTDESQCTSLQPWQSQAKAAIYRVPDTAWARRFGATWMNRLIRLHPDQGFAIFQARRDGGYLVSLRSPQKGPLAHWSAAEFASRYPTGGGRVQAAGINVLPEDQLEGCASQFLKELGA